MKLSLLQWNIWYLEDVEKVLGVIGELSPDILCLQELTQNSKKNPGIDTAKIIQQNLKFESHCAQAQSWVGPNQESHSQGNGIFSRYPLTDCVVKFIREPHASDKVDYSREGRVYLECDVNVGNHKLRVGTTHMSYAHRFEPSPERLEEDLCLLQLILDKEKYFFAADLNAPPSSNLVKTLSSKMQNAGPNYELNTWTTKPFNYQGFQETELNWRLDYIFASSDIEILSARTIETQVSDHLPILVTFNLDGSQ